MFSVRAPVSTWDVVGPHPQPPPPPQSMQRSWVMSPGGTVKEDTLATLTSWEGLQCKISPGGQQLVVALTSSWLLRSCSRGGGIRGLVAPG